jgi:two-component sensor histidine kinase
MMKNILKGSFILMLISACAFAQTNPGRAPGELKALIAKSHADTNRVKLLTELGTYYLKKAGSIKSNQDSAQILFKSATELSQKVHSLKFENYTLKFIGERYMELEDFSDAATYFMKALDNYKKAGDTFNEALTWNRFAELWPHFNKVQLTEKRLKYEKARALFIKLYNIEGECQALKEIADIDLQAGDFTLSEKELLQVIAKYKAIHYKKTQYAYDLLAGVYHLKGDTYKELLYRLEVLKSMEASKDTSQAKEFYCRLSGTYYDLKQYDKSLEYAKLSFAAPIIDPTYHVFAAIKLVRVMIALKKEHEALRFLNAFAKSSNFTDTFQRYMIDKAFGDCYNAMHDFANAEKHYLKTLLLFSDDRMLEAVYENITEFYLNYKHYKTAKFYVDILFKLPEHDMTTIALRQIHFFKFKTDSAFGRYLPAIEQYQKFKQLNDSIFNSNKLKEISELQVKYETGKKEKSILFLENKGEVQQIAFQKVNLQRNLTLFACFLLLIIVGLAWYGFRQNKRNNLRLQIKQQEINIQNASLHELNNKQKKLITEKEWLLREIHHRVKNNLQTTMSLLNMQSNYLSNDDAIEAIRNSQRRMQAMSLIHQKLYQSESLATINMKIYIEELVAYLNESFKSSGEVKFELLLQHIELDIALAIPIGLIINEAVTNAMKYAFPNNRKGKISIDLNSVSADTYSLSIADDGVGLPSTMKVESTNSLGLNLIRGLTAQIEGKLNMEGLKGMCLNLVFANIKQEEAWA